MSTKYGRSTGVGRFHVEYKYLLYSKLSKFAFLVEVNSEKNFVPNYR